MTRIAMLNEFTGKPREVKSRQIPLSGATAAGAPASGGAARTGAWIADNENAMVMAFLIGLCVWRIIIPGFFTYVEIGTDDVVQASGVVDLFSNQLVWLSLFVVPLVLMRSRWGLARRLLGTTNRVFLLLLLYVGASCYWSLDFGFSIRRYSHLLIFVVACFGACLIAWHPRRFQSLLRPAITSLLIGSVIFGLMRPDLATLPPNPLLGETGRHWRGLTEHKNALGAVASFGAVFWFHGWLYKELKLLPSALGMILSGACLLLSGSSTSMLATAFTCGFFMLIKFAPDRLRRYIPLLVMVFITVILIYCAAVLKLIPGLDVLITGITSATGKEATFTGRTPIWEVVKEHIAMRPWLGSGYGGFWTGDLAGTESSMVKAKVYFYPSEGHNGYLDVLNDMGIVGLSLLVTFFFTYLAAALRLLKTDLSQGTLYIGLLFYQLLSNLAESEWLSIALPGLLLVFATIATARGLLDLQLQDQFPQRKMRMGRQRRERRPGG
jgi:exopolysaccharide production protein ExoQ